MTSINWESPCPDGSLLDVDIICIQSSEIGTKYCEANHQFGRHDKNLLFYQTVVFYQTVPVGVIPCPNMKPGFTRESVTPTTPATDRGMNKQLQRNPHNFPSHL